VATQNGVCVVHRETATDVIHEMRWPWGKLSLPPPTQVHGDLPCTGDTCGDADGCEGRVVYCNKDCRLHHEFELFT
jgi:hypothetical protein